MITWTITATVPGTTIAIRATVESPDLLAAVQELKAALDALAGM